MGDRFYAQQAGKTGNKGKKSVLDYKPHEKPKRKLKADYVTELCDLLGTEIKGLEKLTISSLQELIESVEVLK